MTNLLQSLRSGPPSRRSSMSFSDYVQTVAMMFQGHQYMLSQTGNTIGPNESLLVNFPSYVQSAFMGNPVVGACLMARLMLFTEARFQFRRLNNGRPGDLFGTADLALLERPDRNMTTGELLARMEQDASLAGNWYATPRIRKDRTRRVRRMRPDWVTIIAASEESDADPNGLDVEVIGYVYQPGGPASSARPVTLLAENVAHFSPIPDPLAHWRGISWVSMAARNVEGHSAATEHKLAFFRNGATPNMVVKMDPTKTLEQVREFRDLFNEDHEGLANAYKTLFLGGGAEAQLVGSTFEQMAFKTTQGADETLICAAAGVPAIIVGVSEGLEASTYSNYGQARRKFGDHWARPQWRMASACLESLVPPPDGSQLWYDDRDIAFLREDQKDAATIVQTDAMSIKALTDAGYEPSSVVAAVQAGDLNLLKHSGLYSVQLQPAGADTPPAS